MAISSMGMMVTAPVPSPSFRSAETIGRSPRASRSRPLEGSADLWLAMRAPARHLLHLPPQQHCCHGGGGGGVADAHLPCRQQAISPALELLCQRDAGDHCGHRLVPCHGRALGDAPGPTGHVAAQQAALLHRVGNPDVHREHLCSSGPGHAADTGLPPGHGGRHRGRHLRPDLGDPLLSHTVICAEDGQHLSVQTDIRGPLDSGGPDHRLLQQAQAPDGLGDGVPAAGRLRHSPLIRRRDAGDRDTQYAGRHNAPS